MDSVCRTCLCIIRNGCVLNPVHQLKPDSEVNDRHKLEACVPELSIDIVLEPIICKTCKESLALAFRFKTMCLESEKTLYNYIQRRRQNENCTNLLDSCDLLALVRNDIILEHSYSSVGKHSAVSSAENELIVDRTVISDEPAKLDADHESVDEDKRILRPRTKIECDVNSNKLATKDDDAKGVLRRKRNKLLAARMRLQRRTRSAEKSFICKSCNKSFARQRQLAVHRRTHVDAKPFTCSICKISFALKAHLSGHSHIHTEEKSLREHRCGSCNNLFKDFVSYKRHIKKYLGKCVSARRYSKVENGVNDVDKNDPEGLFVERRRSKRLKYFCKVCRRGFTTTFSRNRHAQYQHVDE